MRLLRVSFFCCALLSLPWLTCYANLEGMKKALGNRNAAIVLAATRGLGEEGGSEAKGILIEGLKTRPWYLRFQAIALLEEVAHTTIQGQLPAGKGLSPDDVLELRYEIFEDYCDPRAIATFRQMLCASDLYPRKIRSFAIYLLGEAQSKEALGELMMVIRLDLSEHLKIEAIQAVGKIRNKVVLPLLVKSLSKPPSLCMSAVNAIGEIGADEGVVPLVHLYNQSPPVEIRFSILLALKKIGTPNALESLRYFSGKECAPLKRIAQEIVRESD